MGKPLPIIFAAVTSFSGCIFLAAGIQGWFKTRLNYFERATLTAGGMLLFNPGYGTDLLGLVLIALGLIRQDIKVKGLFRMILPKPGYKGKA
jgi:TRAP-type uncharacterized transport system fused permease subunit